MLNYQRVLGLCRYAYHCWWFLDVSRGSTVSLGTIRLLLSQWSNYQGSLM